jgi:hypothetical protein
MRKVLFALSFCTGSFVCSNQIQSMALDPEALKADTQRFTQELGKMHERDEVAVQLAMLEKCKPIAEEMRLWLDARGALESRLLEEQRMFSAGGEKLEARARELRIAAGNGDTKRISELVHYGLKSTGRQR